MPFGYLIGVAAIAALVLLTLISPREPHAMGGLAFRVAAAYNEVPFLFIYLIAFSSIGPLTEPLTAGNVFALILGLLVVLGLAVIAWQGTLARPAIERALSSGLGADWGAEVEPTWLARLRRHPPLGKILLMPLVFRPRHVERARNVSYGEAGRFNLLDVYWHRSRPANAPVLVHLHGGGFYGGRKSMEARALLFRFASQGWVTISADYRLRPGAGFFDHLIDVKKVLAWVRRHGPEFGADPSTVFLAGGSAGGTLASLAALTQNDPRYQPGFEHADTSVTGAASLYGWYGGYYEMGGPQSEFGVLGYDSVDAPPFFIAHGTKDSLAYVETARRFVAHLRSDPGNVVVYAELPHGQHAFDLFHSFRFSATVDGIEVWASWVRSGGKTARTRQLRVDEGGD